MCYEGFGFVGEIWDVVLASALWDLMFGGSSCFAAERILTSTTGERNLLVQKHKGFLCFPSEGFPADFPEICGGVIMGNGSIVGIGGFFSA